MTRATASAATAVLDADDLIAAAARQAGGEPQVRFRPALARLTQALDTEAGLHAAGRQAARRALIGALVTQAQQAACPAAGTVPDRPLIITGMFRTGTTLLQNLLAEHPAVRAPRLWELLAPAAPAGSAAARRALAESAARYVTEYYAAAPAFRSIHPLAPDRPEECHRLTGVTFTADIYCMRYRVPSYAAWLAGQDLTAAYRYHRTLLGCLLARQPAGPGQHLVLKCPSHLWHLSALSAVYPGARIVRLHRHVSACLPSACSLTAVIRAARSPVADKREIGQYWLGHASRALCPPGRRDADGVLDIGYDALVADPVATAERVREFAGIPPSAGAASRMRRFLAASPAAKHGTHRYHLADFALDTAELERRFAPYHAEFGLKPS
ncbi:MAG TPA: sulfotransferase [Streptosporangiaceae bacterium]|nr:sulfotransferase [Streptosporangiaceae bacterium]